LTAGAKPRIMHIIKFNALLVLFFVTLSACLGCAGSSDQIKWGNSEHLTPKAIHFISDDVYFVAGYFNSRSALTQNRDVVMEPKGLEDAFITKYNSNSAEWTITIGGTGSTAHVNDLASDSDNNLIAVGAFKGSIDVDPSDKEALLYSKAVKQWDFDVFVCSYSEDGKLNWVQSFGEAGGQYIYALDIDDSNDIYIGGFYSDDITQTKSGDELALPNQGDADGFVIKLSPSGEVLWSMSVGGPAVNMVLDIFVDENELYVSGDCKSRTEFNSNIGNPVILHAPEESTYAFLAKYTLDGELLWVKDWGGLWCDASTIDIVDNSVILSGQVINVESFNPDSNLDQDIMQHNNTGSYISALTSDGEFLWARQFVESSRAPEVKSIGILGNYIFVVGSYAAPLSWLDQDWNSYEISNNNNNYYLLKLDTGGKVLDFNTWGTFKTITIEDCFFSDNQIVMLGTNNGQVSISKQDISE